jgi:hypothetical protein
MDEDAHPGTFACGRKANRMGGLESGGFVVSVGVIFHCVGIVCKQAAQDSTGMSKVKYR